METESSSTVEETERQQFRAGKISKLSLAVEQSIREKIKSVSKQCLTSSNKPIIESKEESSITSLETISTLTLSSEQEEALDSQKTKRKF